LDVFLELGMSEKKLSALPCVLSVMVAIGVAGCEEKARPQPPRFEVTVKEVNGKTARTAYYHTGQPVGPKELFKATEAAIVALTDAGDRLARFECPSDRDPCTFDVWAAATAPHNSYRKISVTIAYHPRTDPLAVQVNWMTKSIVALNIRGANLNSVDFIWESCHVKFVIPAVSSGNPLVATGEWRRVGDVNGDYKFTFDDQLVLKSVQGPEQSRRDC
jgi:hypothetical protein